MFVDIAGHCYWWRVLSDRFLIVFVKAPRVGMVKTRLAAEIGAPAARDAYRALLRAVLLRIESIENVQLRYSPDDAVAEISRWLKPSWTSAAQGKGDLGERLTRAFAEAFGSGASRVVVIGSDCPWMNADDVEQAWRALESNDLVLGPATDGGYWLIGLRAPAPELFSNMEWSTATVLRETLRRARDRSLRVQLLRELRDVDTLEDWQAFSRDNSFAWAARVE